MPICDAVPINWYPESRDDVLEKFVKLFSVFSAGELVSVSVTECTFLDMKRPKGSRACFLPEDCASVSIILNPNPLLITCPCFPLAVYLFIP